MISLIEEAGTKAGIVAAGEVHPKPIDREKQTPHKILPFKVLLLKFPLLRER